MIFTLKNLPLLLLVLAGAQTLVSAVCMPGHFKKASAGTLISNCAYIGTNAEDTEEKWKCGETGTIIIRTKEKIKFIAGTVNATIRIYCGPGVGPKGVGPKYEFDYHCSAGEYFTWSVTQCADGLKGVASIRE